MLSNLLCICNAYGLFMDLANVPDSMFLALGSEYARHYYVLLAFWHVVVVSASFIFFTFHDIPS